MIPAVYPVMKATPVISYALKLGYLDPAELVNDNGLVHWELIGSIDED